jgi:hypothetical protein
MRSVPLCAVVLVSVSVLSTEPGDQDGFDASDAHLRPGAGADNEELAVLFNRKQFFPELVDCECILYSQSPDGATRNVYDSRCVDEARLKSTIILLLLSSHGSPN